MCGVVGAVDWGAGFMRQFVKRPKRSRSAVKPKEEAGFDLPAVCLAFWLGMLVLVKCVELLPSLPSTPVLEVDAWNTNALGF